MKKYDVTLTGHFEKTVSIYADSHEQAAEKLKIVLFDTDLITFCVITHQHFRGVGDK